MTGEIRRRLSFEATANDEVSALYFRPRNAWALCALAHGAGAGMDHPFMTGIADRLYESGVATFRYQFPYMEAGRKRPDATATATKTVRAAVARAAALAPDLPLFAGGKSFGARMTSTACASDPLPGTRGIVFLGFPLHASGRQDDARARHLDDVRVPMLFVQGTRDPLANLDLVRGVVKRLGRRAVLHVVDGGDHSFNVLKRSGRRADDVMAEIQGALVAWARALTKRNDDR